MSTRRRSRRYTKEVEEPPVPKKKETKKETKKIENVYANDVLDSDAIEHIFEIPIHQPRQERIIEQPMIKESLQHDILQIKITERKETLAKGIYLDPLSKQRYNTLEEFKTIRKELRLKKETDAKKRADELKHSIEETQKQYRK